MIIDPSVLPMFLTSAFLVMMLPGADMILIVANSASSGRKSGVVTALGIASGACIHFIAAALGISAIILASELSYDVIRILGAGYLAWVGYQYITTKSMFESVQGVERRSLAQVYRQGVLTNLLNPKAILFNLSFVPQFVSVGYGAVWAQMLTLGAILIIVGILINLSIVIMSSQLGSLINDKQSSAGKVVEKAAGILLISLAVYVAVARKPV